MKSTFSLIIIFFVYLGCFAQDIKSYTVSGKVVDSLNIPLPYTTVVILSIKDSSLLNYSVSNDFGLFEMDQVQSNEYILQLSFMGYRTFSKKIKVEGEDKTVNLGTIRLSSDDQLLREINVEGEYIPIVFRNDTVEYNANSFKTQQGANAEKLLSKMPGIEIDSDGEITAHGEKVNKIYVDGKEFFGDDPKIATKNIPADAIDKVQVYDKKSDLAEYTGVDDGERSRSINITLKKDRKKGIFGEAKVGIGHKNRYQGKLNVNRFSETAQFTSLLMANNVNEQGFSYQDYFNFMGGISNVIKTGKMNFDPSETGIPINVPGMNNGIASTLAGGINYNQDIAKNTHLISSFFINNSNSDIVRNTISNNFLPQSNYTSSSDEITNQIIQNYRLNAKVQHEFNDKNRLDISGIGIYSSTKKNGKNLETQLFSNGVKNLADGNSNVIGKGINTTISLDYKKKFQKKGRSINGIIDFYYLDNKNSTNVLNERTTVLNNGNSSIYSLNQIQNSIVQKLEYYGKIAFTEQVSSKAFIIADYSYYNKKRQNDKEFFDNLSQPSTLLTLLSNYFTSKYLFHQLGFKYNYKLNKNMFVLGFDAQYSNLQGSQAENSPSINQNFQVILPNVSWTLQKGMASRAKLNYSTTFSEPSISQLQPVIDNSNPLAIYTGNPNLKPEYNHNLNFNWFTYNAFTTVQKGIYLNAYLVNNNIVNAQFFDSISKFQTTTPQNTQDRLGLNSGLRYGFRINKIKTKINTGVNFSINQGYNLVQNQENKSLTYNYGGNISFSNTNNKKIDAKLEISANANLNQIGIASQQNSAYINTKITGEINWEVKKDWEIGVMGTHNMYSGSSMSSNQQFFILDAFVGRNIFKNRKGHVKLSVFDALNQRTGISNYGQANYLIESNVNVLKRYFMLTFSYKIIKI